MGPRIPTFADILDHLAGREDPAVTRFLEIEPEAAEAATRLLRATRQAGRAPRLFRAEMRPATPTVLQLLFDSLATPAPALRDRPRPTLPRFLKYGTGEVSVEMQLERVGRGVELRGQVTPAGYAHAAELELRGRVRSAPIDARGVFRFAALPRGRAGLSIGALRIEELEI